LGRWQPENGEGEAALVLAKIDATNF